MQQTPNYNLPQFEGTDFFNKEALNDAFIKIDTGISDLQETINNASGAIAITQEVVDARKGKLTLKEKIEEIDLEILNNNSQLEQMNDGATKLTKKVDDIEIEIQNIKDYSTLNVKWFGAKGDGITDDTNAIKSAFDYIKSLQPNMKTSRGYTLFFPNGVYIINNGFVIDFSIMIKGEGMIKPPSYRNFGTNAWKQEIRPNVTTIKYNAPKSNTTMFKVKEPSVIEGEKYGLDFYIENIMLDGNDGIVVSTDNPSGKGVKDLVINFTTTNSNGLDLTGAHFLRGSSNVYFTGFSGFGLKTHIWQQHTAPVVNLCGIGIITGGDGGITTPYVAFCKKGVQIGDIGLIGATDRIIDCRVEWCEEYGIDVINGGSNRISGFIDRCGYSGLHQGVDAWNMNIDLTIQRCGAMWRGTDSSEIDTDLKRKQGSNAYIFNSRGGNYRFTHIRSGASDLESYQNAKSPSLACSYLSIENVVSLESTMGFENKTLVDYYITNESNTSLIINGQIHSNSGIRIDSSSNKTSIDLFAQSRFRPPMNWGVPSNSVGENGDIMFDSENNVFYGKKNGAWSEL